MQRDIFQKINCLFLEPAYGRRYTTQAQALQDWHAGKDFKIVDGPYCSVRDHHTIVEDLDNPTVLIEYQYNKFVEI